jgi:chemotaxis protein MotB
MAKHEEHEEHENHERWLVSYADFITLLFAFFVVMYAISSVDQKRAIRVENAVRWALHVAGQGGGGDLVLVRDGAMQGARAFDIVPMQKAPNNQKAVENVQSRMQRKMTANAAGDARPSVLVMLEGNKLITRVAMSGLFDSGKATLRPSALSTIDAIFSALADLKRPIRVEGHTDDEGSKMLLDPNWGLSAARAAAVVAYVDATRLIPANQLTLVGYGAQKPVARNDSKEGREANRRIDIVVELDPERGAIRDPLPDAPSDP